MTTVLTPRQQYDSETASSRRRSWVATILRPVGATGAGLVLYASFPPRPLWWLAPVAFAVLAACLRQQRIRAGFGYGYLAGLGFFLPLLVWTGVEVGSVPWFALAAVQATFVALAGAGVAAVSRLPGWPLWAAAVWVAAEALRARVPFGGFPWGKVAFGQADGWFLPFAAVGGTPLLGFFTAVALVADVPLRSSLTPATRLGVVPEATLAALAAAGITLASARRPQIPAGAAAVEPTAGADTRSAASDSRSSA